MDVYIFQSALICAHCAKQYKLSHPKPSYVASEGEESISSDEWPQGPYSNGGGEADTPQHCDMCRTFLENPLTPDGYDYVQEKVDEHYASMPYNYAGSLVTQWAEFYDILPSIKES